MLRAKTSVTVHTGRGTNTRASLYWQQRWYIWNNTTDTAYLASRWGTRIDSCRFSGSRHLPYTSC